MLLEGEIIERQKITAEEKILKARFEKTLIPGLPVDTDHPLLRRKRKPIKGIIDSLVKEALTEKSEFFDAVCDRWSALFPELPAKPIEWVQEKLILAVPNSGQLFFVRSQMAKIRKALKDLPAAPAKWSILFKIQSSAFVEKK
ncbi:MAG: hypothetical protein J6V88_03930 [Kiritimatiellae bacterium]|nr:hypothetical protein [Kiritimatiellia bacterium]